MSKEKRTVRLRLTQTASLSLKITQITTLSFPRQLIKTNNTNSCNLAKLFH